MQLFAGTESGPWGDTQPNYHNSYQGCMSLDGNLDYGLIDDTCSEARSYICEHGEWKKDDIMTL